MQRLVSDTIRTDLGFSDSSFAWVLDDYHIAYGGVLLLCGRLGDYYRHRKLFMLGIVLFTLVPPVCVCVIDQALYLLASAQAARGQPRSAVAVSAASVRRPAPTELVGQRSASVPGVFEAAAAELISAARGEIYTWTPLFCEAFSWLWCAGQGLQPYIRPR